MKTLDIKNYNNSLSLDDFVDIAHENVISAMAIEDSSDLISQGVKDYFINYRKLTDRVINGLKLGYIKYNGKFWISIPIFDNNKIIDVKLRKDPLKENTGQPKFLHYKEGISATLYPTTNPEIFKSKENVFITEGELDAACIMSQGYFAVSHTAGASSNFDNTWIELLSMPRNIYVCYDNDEVGERGAKKLVNRLLEKRESVRLIHIPKDMGKDITDYVRNGGNIDKLIQNSIKLPLVNEGIEEMKLEDLTRILDKIIVKDSPNKEILFLAMLSAFLGRSSLNIALTGRTSSGKTFISTEIAKRLFPKKNVRILSTVSPTSLMHDSEREYDEKTNTFTLDWTNKIFVFTEQPSSLVLEKIRSVTAGDSSDLITNLKVTDKSEKYGLRTKNLLIVGKPCIILCSANSNLDDQELSRFICLNPQSGIDKISCAVTKTISNNSDGGQFENSINTDNEMQALKYRVEVIESLGIEDVIIQEREKNIIDEYFQNKIKNRNADTTIMRDAKYVVGLTKTMALLNFKFRQRWNERKLIANAYDINVAIKLWKHISISRDLGITEEAYNILINVIQPLYEHANNMVMEGSTQGVDIKSICKKYLEFTGAIIKESHLRNNILSILVQRNLIEESKAQSNKQKILYIPTYKGIEQNKSNEEHTNQNSPKPETVKSFSDDSESYFFENYFGNVS